MSERERWVVYPLLFLALGAALRDKMAGRTMTGSIVCQELIVMDEAPFGRQSDRALVRIGRTESTARNPSLGYVYVNGELGVDGNMSAGSINANRYALRGVPLRLRNQASFLADWLRALQQNSRAIEQQKGAEAEIREPAGASQAPQSPTAEEAPPAASEESGEAPSGAD